MDFVVGNPPYVRIHHLRESAVSAKKFAFAQRGMTDLFIVFFEIGFRMLRECGKMALITPSSWLASKAGRTLRDYIVARENLSGVVDLEHFQAFEATTYSLISLFENGPKKARVNYFKFDPKTKARKFVASLGSAQFQIRGNFYFSEPKTLDFLRKVKSFAAPGIVRVKNGFATLADKIFVADKFAFSAGTIDVVKASTGKWQNCAFPYDARGKAIPLEEIREKNPPLFAYFMAHKKRLRDERTTEDKVRWHLFGRTQALGDVGKPKFAVNALLRDLNDVKLVPVPAGKGVYGGLYIVGEVHFDRLREALFCDEFLSYVKALKNYKSGGYYTFGARDLELFLNYKLTQNGNAEGIFERALRLVC